MPTKPLPVDDLEQIDCRRLIDSVKSTVCPACGKAKFVLACICLGCEKSIPVDRRIDVERVTLIELPWRFAQAMEILKPAKLYFPEGIERIGIGLYGLLDRSPRTTQSPLKTHTLYADVDEMLRILRWKDNDYNRRRAVEMVNQAFQEQCPGGQLTILK